MNRLFEAIKAVVPGVISVSVGARGIPSSVVVDPASLQSQAQPIIDAFDWSDSAHLTWEESKEPLLADIKAQAAAAIAENDAFIAITGTLTNAQRDAQLRALTRHDTKEIRATVRLTVRTWR